MFCEVLGALNVITDFTSNDNYTKNEEKFVKTMDYKKFEQILTIINDQSEISDKQYSLYKQEYLDMKFEYITDVLNTDNLEYHTVIDSTDNCLLLNTLSPQYLTNYILDNQNKKYIFLTLNYGSNLSSVAHQSAIMIDNYNKKIYMIDPNGKSDYFDSIFLEKTHRYVENLLSNYFLELNKFGLDYKYVHMSSWNSKNIVINRNFNSEYISNGNCVVTTLMLIHLIVMFEINPVDAFILLNNLSNDELLYIIKEYSIGIYNILSNK